MAEFAIVCSVVILLTLTTISIAMGSFRNQQVAYLTREGSRWAAVHGPGYQSAQGASAPTAQSVMAAAVTPKLVGMDASLMTPTLTWNTSSTPPTVTFRLDYKWTPEVSIPSVTTVTLTSTSTQPITY